MITAEKYLELFEKNIVIPGVESGVLEVNDVMVPVKDGKLDDTPFGKFLGNSFEYKSVLSIDWYGLLKKSTGFRIKCESYTDVEVKRLRSGIVHFASIKIEDIAKINKTMVTEFPGFKSYLVSLRAFKKK